MYSTIYRKKGPLLVFLTPMVTFLGLYLFYPFMMNIYNSFCHIQQLGGQAQGFNAPFYSNYLTMFHDPYLHTALKNSALMLLFTIVFQVGIALGLSLLVDNISKGAQFYRTVYFLPIVISATALGLLFNLVFMDNGGMMNQLLFGQDKDAYIYWKDIDSLTYNILLFGPVMWQYVGFYFVILVTGLNNIPSDIYEAAKIDGATAWKRVKYITLPLLRNVINTCVILAITGSLKVFDLPYIMLGDGHPMNQSWLLGTYMYNQTFQMSNVDYGAAIAVLIVVLGVSISKLAHLVVKDVDY